MAELSEQSISDLRATIQSLVRTVGDLRTELVNREVYASDQRGLEREMAALHRAIDAEVSRLGRDTTDLETKVDRAEERRAADRRLLLASFVLPIVLMLLNLYVSSQVVGR